MESDLDQLGLLIDQAADAKDIAKLDQAIDRCSQFLHSDTSIGYKSIAHYFLANAWSGKRLTVCIGDDACAWEQPELEKEILHLRKALLFSVQESIPVRSSRRRLG